MDDDEPPTGDKDQYNQRTEGKEVLILEPQKLSQLEKISSEPALTTKETDDKSELYNTIETLRKETQRLSEEFAEFCPYSGACSKESRKDTNKRNIHTTEIITSNRIGIDTNCSKKKSYHCDVLKIHLGNKGFKEYLEKNLISPPAGYDLKPPSSIISIHTKKIRT